MTTGSQFVALSEAYGSIASAIYPYRITFSRSSVTKGTAGGNIVGAPSDNSPADLPCRYRPANGKEIQLAGQTVSGVLYSIAIPNSFSNALVDVDSGCVGTIAATTGGEPSSTYKVVAPLRDMGLQIVVLATRHE